MIPSHLTLSCYIEEEDGQYVATIRDLDVSSYGDTIDDTVKYVMEALQLHLETLIEDGELEETLQERGVLGDRSPLLGT